MKNQKHGHKEVIDDTVNLEGNVVESPEDADSKKLKEAEAQALEFKNMYLRALADYKNLENRMNQERERMRSNIQKQIIEKFLPVLDNLDQAEVFTTDQGLKMISASFKQTFKELGVTEVELIGKEYDPHTAEVIDVVSGETDDVVCEVLQKAYALNGEIIRPGKVKVSKSGK